MLHQTAIRSFPFSRKLPGALLIVLLIVALGTQFAHAWGNGQPASLVLVNRTSLR